MKKKSILENLNYAENIYYRIVLKLTKIKLLNPTFWLKL